MLPEVKSAEPQLKQILYGALEHIQATKAALYLNATADLNDKVYELATSYKFEDAPRRVLKSSDDLVDRLAVKRGPFFVNSLAADPRLAELLFRQSTECMLAMPIYFRSRLVGFIDMRDKAGKKPFEMSDIEAAQRIADEILALLSAKAIYGVARIPVALVDPEPATPKSAPAPDQAPPLSMPVAGPDPSRRIDVSQAGRAIDAARDLLSKRQLTQASKRTLSGGDIDAVRLLIPSALAIPGAVVVALSVVGHPSNPISVGALGRVDSDTMTHLQNDLAAWLTNANHPGMISSASASFPFGAQSVPVTAEAITAMLTLPLSVAGTNGLLLTVGFERLQDAEAHRALSNFIRVLEPAVESAMLASSGRSDRVSVAEKLLEPDFQRYPALIDHTRAVSNLAHRFALSLDLQPSQIETIRIAALVHDVGMRLLDYDRLYRKGSLTPEEVRTLQEHPIVGAALVEPLFGSDIAQAVLRHHERVDGKGYPSRISGTQIPFAARVLQICDAWVTMTSERSYEMAIPPDVALTKLREGAGSQFDDALVQKFSQLVSERA